MKAEYDVVSESPLVLEIADGKPDGGPWRPLIVGSIATALAPVYVPLAASFGLTGLTFGILALLGAGVFTVVYAWVLGGDSLQSMMIGHPRRVAVERASGVADRLVVDRHSFALDEVRRVRWLTTAGGNEDSTHHVQVLLSATVIQLDFLDAEQAERIAGLLSKALGRGGVGREVQTVVSSDSFLPGMLLALVMLTQVMLGFSPALLEPTVWTSSIPAVGGTAVFALLGYGLGRFGARRTAVAALGHSPSDPS